MAKGLPQNKLQQAFRSPGKPSGMPRRRQGLFKKLFFILILGGVAGWLYANPEQLDKLYAEVKTQYKKIEPTVAPVLEYAKPVIAMIEPVVVQVKELLPPSLRRAARYPISSLMRFYDSLVPVEYKNKAADFLPSLFASPYFCKVTRVESAGGGSGSAAPKKISMQGASLSQMVGVGAIIFPGNRLLVDLQNQAEVSCGNLRISISPGSQIHFLRGHKDRKVFEASGALTVNSLGNAAMAFAFPFGEVEMDVIKNSKLAMQLIVQKEQSTMNITEGNIAFTWADGKVDDSNRKLLQVIAGVNTNLQMQIVGSGIDGGIVDARILAPGKETTLMAAGQWSGMASAPQMAPAIMRSSKPVVANPTTNIPAYSERSTIPTITLVSPIVNAKTSSSQNQVDVLLAWQENPEQRLFPCDIEMAADAALRQILAKYKSSEMRLLLKGMRPGVYFWRVHCFVNGKNISSPVGRVQVADGRKLPSVPILLSPGNREKISGPEVVYQWEKVESSKSYILQLSQDPGFKKFNEYHARQGTGLKMNLKKRGQYYWRVYGIGKSKEEKTGFSAVRGFTY